MSPSPNALWLVAGHLESSNPVEQLHELRDALGHGKLGTAGLVEFPQFKVSPRRIVIRIDVNVSSQRAAPRSRFSRVYTPCCKLLSCRAEPRRRE